MMKSLSDQTIEKPEVEFAISFTLFGTLTRPASQVTVKVLAETRQGALRICKAYYRRSSDYRVLTERRIEKPFQFPLVN